MKGPAAAAGPVVYDKVKVGRPIMKGKKKNMVGVGEEEDKKKRKYDLRARNKPGHTYLYSS